MIEEGYSLTEGTMPEDGETGVQAKREVLLFAVGVEARV